MKMGHSRREIIIGTFGPPPPGLVPVERTFLHYLGGCRNPFCLDSPTPPASVSRDNISGPNAVVVQKPRFHRGKPGWGANFIGAWEPGGTGLRKGKPGWEPVLLIRNPRRTLMLRRNIGETHPSPPPFLFDKNRLMRYSHLRIDVSTGRYWVLSIKWAGWRI